MKILLRNSPQTQWQKLEPFEFGGEHGEQTLEKLLEESPDLLPTEEGKPVLFFRSQVTLGSNAVDLLGVDADGAIVIVECKLEANREVRREVVGQILEYAGQLHGMSYEEFEDLPFESATPPMMSNSELSLVEMVRQCLKDNGLWSESDFREGIQRRLESGDFRLVIAVNHINEELKGIVEYLGARGGVRLEALELQQFTYENHEVLVPEMYGIRERNAGRERPETFPQLLAAFNAYNEISKDSPAFGNAHHYRMVRVGEKPRRLHYQFSQLSKSGPIIVAFHAGSDPIKKKVGSELAGKAVAGKELSWEPDWRGGEGRLAAKFPLETPPQAVAAAMRDLIDLTRAAVDASLMQHTS